MTCIDIRCQEDYDMHSSDATACLHIFQGEYSAICGSARIDSVFGSARIQSVRGPTRIDSVRGSAIVEQVRDNAHIGAVCDSARIGYARDSVVIDSVCDWAGIGCVRDRAQVGSLADCAVVGSVEGWAGISAVSGSARIGSVRDDGRIGLVRGSATVGSLTGSARIGAVSGMARIGHVGGTAQVTAAELAVVHAFSGSVTAARNVTVYQHGPVARVTGGMVVRVQAAATLHVSDWAADAGVRLVGSSLVVFKAVDRDLVSDHHLAYRIGEKVVAADWNPARRRGNGLHFSPHPLLAASTVAPKSRRYLACLVPAAEAVVIDTAEIKARSCLVLHETDSAGHQLNRPGPSSPEIPSPRFLEG